MPTKPTKSRKKVKPTVIPLDLLARFAGELGRKEAARRFKVHPSTLGRWLKKGVPEDKSRRVQVAIRRRTQMQERNAQRSRRTEIEAEYAGLERSRRKPKHLDTSDTELEELQWQYLKTTIPQLRELAESAWDAGDLLQHRLYANQMTTLRGNFKELRVKRLKRLPWAKLHDADESNIDAIVQELAEDTGLNVKYFYRMWSTPEV